MNRHLSLGLVALLLMGLTACEPPEQNEDAASSVQTASREPGADAENSCPSLVGSWELVSIASDAPALTGEFDTDPEYTEAPTLKILNNTHWMFIRQSSDQFIHAQGGHYRLEPGGRYTEIVEYSALPDNIGKEFTFTCRLEGDSLWHHTGGIGDNRYDEVWRRVD